MFGAPTPFKKTGLTKNKWDIKFSPDVKKAKEYQIENLYNKELKKTGKTLMGLCPFHQEDTPSFHIYPETNTWYCFACGEGGDVISFYMKLHDVDFQIAVAELTK